jgi:hypothetical protein
MDLMDTARTDAATYFQLACPHVHLLPACLPTAPPPSALPLQTPHGIKRKESEALQVQHETQGANKKPRVVWSVEMHQQVGFEGCWAGPAVRLLWHLLSVVR